MVFWGHVATAQTYDFICNVGLDNIQKIPGLWTKITRTWNSSIIFQRYAAVSSNDC